MIKVVIVDDEEPAILELKFLVEKYDEVEVIACYDKPKKALKEIPLINPDVVFLDIEMPNIDGITLASKLINKCNDLFVVFATAFEDYAIRAFEINAVDYILKPIDEGRLENTIKRIANKIKINEVRPDYEKVFHKFIEKKEKKKVPVWENDCIVLLDLENIIYCMAEEGKVKIYGINGIYRYEQNLTILETYLKDENFFRCHRSFLINIDRIQKIKPWFNNTYIVNLKGYDGDVPVSRKHMKELKKIYNF